MWHSPVTGNSCHGGHPRRGRGGRAGRRAHFMKLKARTLHSNPRVRFTCQIPDPAEERRVRLERRMKKHREVTLKNTNIFITHIPVVGNKTNNVRLMFFSRYFKKKTLYVGLGFSDCWTHKRQKLS